MKYKILIIDDTEVIRAFLHEVLTDYGYETDLAQNGKEAMEKASENEYLMAFCDVHMPVMNGLQTVKGLQKINPNLPIVMTDSYPGQIAEEAQQAGALTCLSKPFSLDELRHVINSVKESRPVEVQ